MTRKINRFAVLIVLLLPGLLNAAEGHLEDRVRKVTLQNGIRVLLLERPVSPTVSLYIRQRAGAVDEVSGKTGTAHLLEHMMFKGTTTIGTRDYATESKLLNEINILGRQIDLAQQQSGRADVMHALRSKLKALQDEHRQWMIPNELDRIYTEQGAEEMNAGTGQDLTTYHVSLPSNKIELWARIESDRLQDPVFREFYTERDVVIEERRQRIEMQPRGKLAEQFYAAAFQAHPYGRPILGWPSDLRYLDTEDLRGFFQRATLPRKTVIAVVGLMDPEATLTIIRKYFEPIPATEVPAPAITEEPPQSGERRVEVLFDAKPQFLMGYHKPSLPAPEDYVFDIIEAILSEGRTSRLYRKLVEETQMAESVRTVNGMPGARYPNLFIIQAIPRPPHVCRDLEAAIDQELERLKREPVPQQELQKVKNQMKADFIRSLNSNSALAGMLSYYETLLGDYRYITNYLKEIDKITASEIMLTAQKYLIRDNRTVAVLVPGPTKTAPPGPGANREEKNGT